MAALTLSVFCINVKALAVAKVPYYLLGWHSALVRTPCNLHTPVFFVLLPPFEAHGDVILRGAPVFMSG